MHSIIYHVVRATKVVPADRCFCTGTSPLLQCDFSAAPHRAADIFPLLVRESSAMFDVFCS